MAFGKIIFLQQWNDYYTNIAYRKGQQQRM